MYHTYRSTLHHETTVLKVKDHLDMRGTQTLSVAATYYITWHTTLTYQETSKQHLVYIITHELYHHYHLVLSTPASTSIFTPRSPTTPSSHTQGQQSVVCMVLRHPSFPMKTEFICSGCCVDTTQLFQVIKRWIHIGCLSRTRHIIPHNQTYYKRLHSK